MTALAQKVDAIGLSSPNYTAELERNGYCIIRGLMPARKVAALHRDLKERFIRTPFCEGEFYGARTKRFGGLLKRSALAQDFVANGVILDIAESILGPFCDRIQLNFSQALEIHPGSPLQAPHRDQDMWRGPTGQIEYLINVMWPFTPYTFENGATLLWKESNQFQDIQIMDDKDAIAAEMDPGDVLIFLGSTLHCAGANRTLRPRTGMVISYCLGWLKPFENQWLVYPPDVARTFSLKVAGLAGYQIHRPNIGNYEGQCPSILLHDEVPDFLGAKDELPPGTVEPLKLFNALRAQQHLTESET